MLDAAMIFASLVVRHWLLLALDRFGAENESWVTGAVLLIADFGLVGTVLVITVFDLLKRLRNGYRRTTEV